MVQDLVHPSMYPLVYGRTHGFKEEKVGVSDAVEHWAGKGAVIPKGEGEIQPTNPWRGAPSYDIGGSDVPPEYWSSTYQWLPANVSLKEDGSVKFTSYINNLHPTRYPDIYCTIEQLVETSLPLWDQCLRLAVGYEKFEGAGRLDTRTGKPSNPE
jgi:hypothetical protein